MRTLKIPSLFVLALPSACLALQDPPTRAASEDCEADDWCEAGLVCLRVNGPQNPGNCSTKGACYADNECDPGMLCQGSSYSGPGACQANTGCTTNAQCASGMTCFRGSCWQMCTTTLQCGTSQICMEVPCPVNATNCPDACQTL